jgi:hypothetical protein
VRIILDIPDEAVASLQAHCDTQIRVESDPVTGAQKHIRLYEGPEALIIDAVHQTVHHCVRQYPTGKLREQMAQEKAAAEALKQAVAPKVVAG